MAQQLKWWVRKPAEVKVAKPDPKTQKPEPSSSTSKAGVTVEKASK